MSTLEQLELESKLEEAKKQINLLWKCKKEDLDKAVKWLKKIMGNILRDPNNPKFQSINFSKMMKLFRNARPGLHILFSAGFKQTVDGSKIQIDPKYFSHLARVLTLLNKKIEEPEREPTPPPKPKSPQQQKKPAPVKKQETRPKPAAMDIDDQKPLLTKPNNQYMDALKRGEAIVVFNDINEAAKVIAQVDGAEIDNSAVKVEFYITDDDRELSKRSDVAEVKAIPMDVEETEEAEKTTPNWADDSKTPTKVEPSSKNVKISGLTANITEASLKTVIKQLTSCIVKEIWYKKKARRGEMLGGSGGDVFEDDDLLAQIHAMKGNHTKLRSADLEGKTAEEKRLIMQQKREQYRRDKQKHAMKETNQKSANIREQRKAALKLKEAREQRQMEELVRKRKRDKEREKREKERVLQKIKADKERRRREREARERAKKQATS